MHDNRVETRLLHLDNITGKLARQVRVDDGVAAIFYDNHLVVIKLHERQRFRQNARNGLRLLNFRHDFNRPRGYCSGASPAL